MMIEIMIGNRGLGLGIGIEDLDQGWGIWIRDWGLGLEIWIEVNGLELEVWIRIEICIEIENYKLACNVFDWLDELVISPFEP